MLVRFRAAEGCEPQTNFIWDTVWVNSASGGFGEWILAGAADPLDQRGGLRSSMQLLSSIVIQLFTDARLPDSAATPGRPGDDPRGWWGNSLRLDGEPDAEMGSLLWTLERTPLNQAVVLAPDICKQALQVFLDQGAVERFDIAVSADPRGFMAIDIRAYDHLGNPALAQVFDVLWQQVASPAQMTFAR